MSRSPDKVSAQVIVRGRVQGVFFRAETADQARQWGVTGWVRNRSDGAVEAFIEGDKQAVEQMIAWCRHGPAAARVDDVKVTWEEPQDLSDFQMRY